MKKQVKLLILAGVTSVLCASTAFAGWEQDEIGYYFMYEDGTYAQSAVREINGKNYAFDTLGYMVTGWQYTSFKWLYFEPTNGEQVYGWAMVDGKWYYMDPENGGAMVTYWKNIEGNRYYFDESGAMAQGLFYLSDSTSGSDFAYQTDENGALYRNMTMTQGTIEYQMGDEGVVLYRNSTTRIVAEELEDGDAWQYLFRGDGVEFEEQKAQNQMYVDRAQKRTKNDRYEDYQKDVNGRVGTTRELAQARWEEKTREELTEKLMEETAIQDFINSVTYGGYYLISIEDIGSVEDISEYYGYTDEYDDEYDDEYYDDEDYY